MANGGNFTSSTGNEAFRLPPSKSQSESWFKSRSCTCDVPLFAIQKNRCMNKNHVHNYYISLCIVLFFILLISNYHDTHNFAVAGDLQLHVVTPTTVILLQSGLSAESTVGFSRQPFNV